MSRKGATTFKKRQKEQERKERAQEKFAKRMDRKRTGESGPSDEISPGEVYDGMDVEDVRHAVDPDANVVRLEQ